MAQYRVPVFKALEVAHKLSLLLQSFPIRKPLCLTLIVNSCSLTYMGSYSKQTFSRIPTKKLQMKLAIYHLQETIH